MTDQVDELLKLLAPSVEDWTEDGSADRARAMTLERIAIARTLATQDTRNLRSTPLRRWLVGGIAAVVLVAGTASATAATLNARNSRDLNARPISSVVVSRDDRTLTISYGAGACDADVHTLIVYGTSAVELTVTANERTAEPCIASRVRRTTVAMTDQPVGGRSIRDGFFGRPLTPPR